MRLAAHARRAVPLHRHLSLRLGRPRAGGRHQSLLATCRPIPRSPRLRDAAIYPNINRADYAVTTYPPVAQVFFLAVTRIAETLTMMRLAMLACEAVDRRRAHRPAAAAAAAGRRVVAYAWHPLAVWEIAGSGHVDALMVALLMLGVWLLVRQPRARWRRRRDAGGAGQALRPCGPAGLLAAVGLAPAAGGRRRPSRSATCPISAPAAACSAS